MQSSSSRMSVLKMLLGVVILRNAPAAIAKTFTFEVLQVKNCPMSKVDWESASNRLNCNRTHGYHCVPDKYFTSLIEFCYPQGYRLPFEAGNCLELAADGILNHFPCSNTFSSGCPDKFYFSNEIYKYPKCLTINTELRCFDADVPCILEKIYENRTGNQVTSTLSHLTPTFTRNKNTIDVGVFAVIIVFMLGFAVAFCISLALYVISKKRLQSEGETHETEMLLTSREEISNDDQELFSLVEACKNGDFENYRKLISPSNLKKKDMKGWTILHHAVYDGNYDIFHDLLRFKELDLYERDYVGRTILHIAAKKGNTEVFYYILESKSKDMLDMDDKNGLKPYCYAALAGQVSIMQMIKKTGFDIAKQTKYGETIAHLACIGDSLEILKMASGFHEKGNQESLKTDDEEEEDIIKKKNKMDWTPLQYAAKTGNKEILSFLFEKNVLSLNLAEDLKYPFHSACENGRLEACKYIAKHNPQSIHATDKEGRHAGHFAAKSGDVKVLKYLINECMLQANRLSIHNVNILHIACRHGRFDMCKYIADKYRELVKQESKKGWNAALFLCERGGAEDERIKILKYLVKDHGLFVYHVSRAGKSILYNACANRSYKLCEYLLQNYPDLLTIERSMDPRNGARDPEITQLLEKCRDKERRV